MVDGIIKIIDSLKINNKYLFEINSGDNLFINFYIFYIFDSFFGIGKFSNKLIKILIICYSFSVLNIDKKN